MGVIAQTMTYIESDDSNPWVEQAHQAYKKNNNDACLAILTKACEVCKEELSKKPHSKVYRQEMLLIWDFMLEKVKETLSYIEEKNLKVSKEKINPISSIKAYVVDSLIETEWKKQCIGKFGGPKHTSYSWKESYLKNEQELDQLNDVETKLLWAIKHGHVNYVKFLLSQYDDININQLFFEDKLSIISKAISKNYIKLTQLLLDKNIKLNVQDKFGWSPLHHAINACNIEMVKQLVSHKIALNIRNKEGHTPLHLAIMKNRTDIVKYLLSQGCKVNYKNKKGMSPIYYTLMTKDTHMLEILIENGADLNVKDDFGRTLIHLSTMIGYPSMLKEILKYKIPIDAKDKFGRTALHYAAQYARENCLDLLINAGVKIGTQDNFNDTALIVAAFSENKAETAILHEYECR